MKSVVKSHVCGVTCHEGDRDCNRYCTNNQIEAPGTYTELIKEERDLWMDVLELFAEHDGKSDMWQKLMNNYSIQQKVK